MDLREKVAVVTAGARRLGRAIAVALAQHGSDVVVSYLTSERDAFSTVHTIEKLGRRASAIRADLTVKQQVDSLFQRVQQQFGRLDILVNNAAIFGRTPFAEVTEQDWDRYLDTNLKSVFLCSQNAAALMSEQGAGKIINLACTSGERPWPSYIPYSVSKAGVISLTKAMALALTPKIQVNAISPGPVLLPEHYTQEERVAAVSTTVLGREGSPEDITKAVLFLVEASDYVTGQVIAVDGGRLLK